MVRTMRKLFISFVATVALITGQNVFATTIDLHCTDGTCDSGSATADLGGTFYGVWVDQQSTGTGVINPFLRIQSGTEEEGYNIDHATYGLPMDDKASIYTHTITVGEIPVVTIDLGDGEHAYRQFLVDINQNSGSDHENLTLNQVQIFLGGQAMSDSLSTTLSGGIPVLDDGWGATEVFRMTGDTEANDIWMDYSRNPGSGAGDMFFYVDNSLFSGYNDSDFLTLYTQFGDPGWNSNDGFEEWAVYCPSADGCPFQEVPEPGSLVLLGLGLFGLYATARVRRNQLSS